MRFLALATITSILASCHSATDAQSEYPCLTPASNVGNRALQNQPGYFWSPDDEFAAKAREVPGGFGGMFFGTYKGRGVDGVFNFYLVDLQQAPNAAAALGGSHYHAVQGQYDYLQLKSCYETLGGVWGIDEAFSSDINEGLNRIVLQVRDAAAIEKVREGLRRLQIPQDMVIVEIGAPPVVL